MRVTAKSEATTLAQESTTTTTPFTCTEQEYIDMLVSTNAIRIRPNDEVEKKDLVSKGLDIADGKSTFKIDLPEGGLIVRNVQISSLNIRKVELIFVSETGTNTKSIQGKPTSLPRNDFPIERTGELIIKVLETSDNDALKQVKLSIIACEERFTTRTTCKLHFHTIFTVLSSICSIATAAATFTPGSTVSLETTTSTQPTTTTTVKLCDEMEYINTLVQTNSIRTTPSDLYNKNDFITKGVDFTTQQSTIVINIPSNGAVVRNVKLSSANVAQIEVILTIESTGATVSIRGAPTGLPANEFPTDKVKQIVIKFLNTIDGNAPQDVVLSVIACAEGSVITSTTSTSTSTSAATTTQLATEQTTGSTQPGSTGSTQPGSTGSDATTDQPSTTIATSSTETVPTTISTSIPTTTTKFCDEMELVGLLITNNAISGTSLDRVDKTDLIRKGVNLPEKNPVIVIDIPKGGAIVRDIRLPSKNLGEIEVIFTTESGRRLEPIRGPATALPKQIFPLEKVSEVILVVKATTDDNLPQGVTLSVIACAEDFIVTTTTTGIPSTKETTLGAYETSSGSVGTTGASITSESVSTVSQRTESSTKPQTTTVKYCDEMEYIDTLVSTNSVKILPNDITNKRDLISKGVDFTDKNPSIQIDLPNDGAVVRDIDVTSNNVAQIEVTLITQQGRKVGPIEGGPTSLPTSQFPTEKVVNIIVKIVKTTDNDAPGGVTLSVIACAEGKSTTVSPSNIFFISFPVH